MSVLENTSGVNLFPKSVQANEHKHIVSCDCKRMCNISSLLSLVDIMIQVLVICYKCVNSQSCRRFSIIVKGNTLVELQYYLVVYGHHYKKNNGTLAHCAATEDIELCVCLCFMWIGPAFSENSSQELKKKV